jgi:hypothetical protein
VKLQLGTNWPTGIDGPSGGLNPYYAEVIYLSDDALLVLKVGPSPLGQSGGQTTFSLLFFFSFFLV